MKNALFFLLLAMSFLFSCSEDEGGGMDFVDEEDPMSMVVLTEEQQQTIDYFTEIALGFEFGTAEQVTRKWDTDILITIAGNPTAALLDELDIVLEELNALISSAGITIQITQNAFQANFTIFMGSGEEYGEFFPPAAPFVNSNFGLFFVSFDERQFLTEASMYVDIFRPTPLKQRHLLREELTQALGLARDSDRFPDSIFQTSFQIGCATDYAQIDEVLIRLLYDPRVSTSLSEGEVRSLLEGIINEFI